MSTSAPVIEKIEAKIEHTLQEWPVPGGAVAILQDGQVVSCRGYGVTELEGNNPVSGETLFPIGSCTKAFTAAALGMMVDEGKLDWDDKVICYLPDFQLADEWVTREITIRDLLCHRSGLGRAIRLMTRQSVFDSQDFVRRMRYLPFKSGFREKFGYNNPHFVTAGLILEAVSGRSWAEFIRQRIFQPLDMASSYTSYGDMQAAGPASQAQPHAAACELFFPSELCALDPVQRIPWTDYGENAAGSILSTAADLSHWLQFLMYGSYNGQQLIQANTLAEILAPQTLIRPGDSEMDMLFAAGIPTRFITYGLGWYVSDYRGEVFIFHPGQLNGFVAAIAYSPQKKIGGIILLNTYQTMVHAMIGYDLIDALSGHESDYAHTLYGMLQQWHREAAAGAQQMQAGRPPAGPPAVDAACCGQYVSDLYGEVHISLENGLLHFQYGETPLYLGTLEPWQGQTFVIRYRQPYLDPEFLTFQPAENGQVGALVIDNVDTFHKTA